MNGRDFIVLWTNLAMRVFAVLFQYRHVYGRENAKERTAFNLRPNTSASDSPLIVCNDKFWTVPWTGAGGPVYVSPINQHGKVEPGCSVINGHKSAVQAVQFNRFDSNMLATGKMQFVACEQLVCSNIHPLC